MDLFSWVVHKNNFLPQHFISIKILTYTFMDISQDHGISMVTTCPTMKASKSCYVNQNTVIELSSTLIEHPRLKVVSILKAETKDNKLT